MSNTDESKIKGRLGVLVLRKCVAHHSTTQTGLGATLIIFESKEEGR